MTFLWEKVSVCINIERLIKQCHYWIVDLTYLSIWPVSSTAFLPKTIQAQMLLDTMLVCHHTVNLGDGSTAQAAQFTETQSIFVCSCGYLFLYNMFKSKSLTLTTFVTDGKLNWLRPASCDHVEDNRITPRYWDTCFITALF